MTGLAPAPLRAWWARRVHQVFYGWWIVAAGSVINAVGGGVYWYGFTLFFLPVSRDLGLSRAATSLAFSFSRLEGGVEGPVAGWLIDRFGPRSIILAGGSLLGLGLLLLAGVRSVWEFLVVYAVVLSTGWNIGFFHPLSTAVNSWFLRRRGTALAAISAAMGGGGFVLAPILSYLILNFGWRWAAVASGLLVWAIVLPLALVVHRSPEERGLSPDGAPALAPSPLAPVRGGVEFPVAGAVQTPAFWLLAVAITFRMLVTTALTVHLVPLLVWRGLDQRTAALGVSVLGLGGVGARLLLGWVGDRFSRAALSALGCFVGLGGLLGLFLAPPPWPLPLFLVSLLVLEGSIALNWVLIGDFFGRRHFATLRGVIVFLNSLGTFASPVFAGWVYDRTESYTGALAAFALSLGLAGALFALLRPPKPRAVASP